MNLLDDLRHDLRQGWRALRRTPGFSLMVVLILGLGIGANSALFSVVNAVVLRPLPFADPDRLMMVTGGTTRDQVPDQAPAFADFVRMPSQLRAFQDLAAASPAWSLILTGRDAAEQIRGLYISANLFPVLGVAPAQGRTFARDEDKVGGPPVTILSHGTWQRRFGGDPGTVGKTVTLDGVSTTVVGIMPAGFQLAETDVEVWLPLQQNWFAASGRGVPLGTVVGRLRADSSQAQASAQLLAFAQELERERPDTHQGLRLRLLPLHDQITSKVRPALWLLMAAAGMVLLICCANVANLLLVRTAARRREIAVRTALGASGGRLLRQLLTESLLLSVLAGTAGAALAWLGIDLLLAFSPADLPRYHRVQLDLPVLGFTLLISLTTGVLAGLAPVSQARTMDVHGALKNDQRGALGDRRRTRLTGLLIVAEVALSVVLVIGAGLLARSFLHVLAVNPGFDTEGLLTMQLGLPASHYSQPQQRITFQQQLEATLSALPQVTGVGIVTRLPLQPALNNVTSALTIQGRPSPPGQPPPQVDFRRASTGYFHAIGIPLQSGRLVTRQDVASGTGAVLINEALARRFWPGADPLGKRIRTAASSQHPTDWQTIVGVVGDVRHLGLDRAPQPEVYYHADTAPPSGPVLVLRTTGDPSNLITTVRAQIRGLGPHVVFSKVHSMNDLLGQSLVHRRFALLLLGLFAGLAALLAAVGLYGVMSATVAQRTRELGLRMALGAQSRQVLHMLLGQGLRLWFVGLAAGLAAALGLTRLMASQLYGVSPTDPGTFATLAAALLAVAVLAILLPARRATRIDPMAALRTD